MRSHWDHFLELCKNRIFVMLCGICVLFAILVVRLFTLQIIHGEEYSESITASVSKTLNVPAPRGNIYDRYGRPLAINTVAYSVQIDDSITLDLTDTRVELVQDLFTYFLAEGTVPANTLPISSTAPHSFTFEGTEREQKQKEKAWKTSVGLPKDMANATASECITYLREKYQAPATYTGAQTLAYLSLCLDLNDRNLMALTLVEKLTSFGESISDELPLSQEYPYTLQFNGNETRERDWKLSMGMKDDELSYTSVETLEYLRDYFALPEGLPTDTVRLALGIRYSQFLQRYQQYQTITIATDISAKTLAYVEEKQDIFPCVIVDTTSLRKYPEGQYFSHILGYIRQMTENDYALYQDDLDAEGNSLYAQTDIVGQTGIEKLYERQLNGIDGKISIEVDNQGRRMSAIAATDPVPGKDVYLTLDSTLQQTAFDSLENALREVIITKLTTSGRNATSITELFVSMVNSNHISAPKLLQASSGTMQHTLYERLLAASPTFSKEQEDATAVAQSFLTDGLMRGTISSREMLLVAIEQGKIPATPEEKAAVESGATAPLTLVLNKLGSGELSPAETALDPCTGSVVVTKVGSGDVLASVAYPSYDNNELVNTFNNSYYNDLLQDTNTPLVNRPFKEKKAPGSTFKMITALAGLESGAITTSTIIRDYGLYKDAGIPYARCWIYSNSGATHGSINVTTALELSCNYFFYEVSHRMGNAESGTSDEGITTLNEYMAAFGLNQPTGIELDEYSPTMASPYYKERTVKMFNPDATTSQTRWTDGDTIRAAIGQSVNSYTPAQVTKYVSTLANGGTLYKLHMVEQIQNIDGTIYAQTEDVVENITIFEKENLDAVYRGMNLVTNGTRGTLRYSFVNFPVNVAAKTGTAEEDKNRSSHTWLVCFAPYEDPQIAITVMIPFGEGSGSPAPEVAKAIILEYLGLNEEPSNTNLETLLAQ